MGERADCGKMAASADVRFHWPTARTRHLAFLIHIYGSNSQKGLAGSRQERSSQCGEISSSSKLVKRSLKDTEITGHKISLKVYKWLYFKKPVSSSG